MKIALVSLDQLWEDRVANLERSRAAVARSAALGADLVVFPELTLTGFTMDATSFAESASGSPTVDAFSALAREHAVNIAFGVVLRGTIHPRNTLVVVGRDGAERARYAKLHPFTYAEEDRHYEPGAAPAAAVVDGTTFGLTICYDLRFPELYAALVPACSAVLVIANWPAQRISHWQTLLRARAIDGQCFVVGVNRTGTDAAGNEYPHSSVVIDPTGEAVAPVTREGCIEIVALDPTAVERHRRAFPTLRDRRPGLYRSLPDS
jgi:predicted amidohydrolase